MRKFVVKKHTVLSDAMSAGEMFSEFLRTILSPSSSLLGSLDPERVLTTLFRNVCNILHFVDRASRNDSW
jgi:hypothetical protein